MIATFRLRPSAEFGSRTAGMQSGTRKMLVAGVAIIGIVTQVVWAVALGYPLVMLVIAATRGLAQL